VKTSIRIIIIFLTFLIQNNLYSLEILNKKELKALGYDRSTFYKNNYKGKKTKWFSLEDHLSLKPRFLALVEQDLKINNKKEKYYYIYNSRHNFFRMEAQGEKKKLTPFIRNPLSKRTLSPKTIKDNNISLSQFIEKVLDHCKFSKAKSVRDDSGKSLNFRDEKDCKIKYVNFDKFENLTFKNYEKNQNLSKYNPSIKTKSKVVKNIDKKISNSKNQIKNFKVNIALNWQKKYDLLTGKLSYNSASNTGLIKFNANKDGECFGTFSLQNNKGVWSFSCSKTNITAFGDLFLNDDKIDGKGYDKKNNLIKFVSNKLYE
tara:strand:- start:182 stop:1132 length:951 start_codon:yes stop_codon:yes gene_type:complete